MSIHSAEFTGRLLDTIESDILPKTTAGVATGNKLFGAALLRKSDYTTYLSETNNELENPLWHGEMHLLKRFYEVDESSRVPVKDLIFLSTHEPCSLCLSAITWCGFDNFYYFFSHQDSRDEFAIPHDLNILQEVFGIGEEGYQRKNAFWQCYGIKELLATLEQDESITADDVQPLAAQSQRIEQAYTELSNHYQSQKTSNNIPLN